MHLPNHRKVPHREADLPPIERFQLALSQQELTRLRYSLLFIVPGAVALLGIMVYWSRRS